MRQTKTRTLTNLSKITAVLMFAAAGLSLLLLSSADQTPATVDTQSQELRGDVNNDGAVDIFDLSQLLGTWGEASAANDINNDGVVSIVDLSILLSDWGKTADPNTGGGSPGDCGLAGEVFCENFEDGPYSNGSRNGDFDLEKFSAARLSGLIFPEPTNWIREAAISSCRSGIPQNPLPPNDIAVCDPTTSIQSNHGLTAVAAQNYGDTSIRISQPFDFSNRTGTIRFDASLHNTGLLDGGASIGITGSPLSVPSIVTENGNGSSMESGLMVHFSASCRGASFASARPRVRVYSNYVETLLADDEGQDNWCPAENGVATQTGNLNRVELRLSQNSLEIWASDFSDDGVAFGPLKKMYTSPQFSLPFEQGWVSIGGHNHASVKYGGYASVNTRWDNIAFDGPTHNSPRVYQVSDANIVVNNGVQLGHTFNNKTAQIMDPLPIDGVDVTNAQSAQLTFNVYIDTSRDNNVLGRVIDYRLNDGPWRRTTVSMAMATDAENRAKGRFNYVEDVVLDDLVQGTNQIEFASEGLNIGLAPFVANIDLLIFE